MKKITKISTGVVALAMCSAFVLPAIPAVFADSTPGSIFSAPTTDYTFNIPAIADEYELGVSGTVALPILTGDTTGIIARVFDPSNKEVYDSTDAGATGSFVVSKEGKYVIAYYLSNGATDITLAEKSIKVTKASYYLDFKTNDTKIIPEKINSTYTTEIELPVPTIKKSSDDSVVSGTVVISVTKGTTALTVRDNKYFTPSGVGKYTITYKYLSGSTVLAKKSFTMQATENYANDFDMNYDYASSTPTTANVGVDIVLPAINVTNKTTGDKVAVNYSVIASKDGNDVSATVITRQADGSYVFNANQNGDYVVYYKATNFFGKEIETYSFTIKDVKDNKVPDVAIGFKNADTIVDETHLIPSKINNENIVLPAIYVDDNALGIADYNGSITTERYCRLSAGTKIVLDTENANKKIILNYNPTTAAASITSNIANYVIYSYAAGYAGDKIEGTKETLADGSYTIYYSAKDNSGNEKILDGVKMIVDASFNPLTAEKPVVTFETILPASVKVGEDITFNAPTATDVNDERLVVETVYSYDDFETQTALTSNNGVITIKDVEAGTLKIKVVVKNDSGKENDELVKTILVQSATSGNPTTIDETDLNKTSSDVDLKEYDSAFNQNETVLIPAMTFGDVDGVEDTDVRVFVRDLDNNKITVTNKTVEYNPTQTEITVKDMRFVAGKSGRYVISYVVTDVAGNMSVFVIETSSATATVKPSVAKEVFSTASQELELGETLTLPVPSVVDGNGNTVENPNYTVSITGNDFNTANMKNIFEPYATGIYTIKYTITASGLNTTKEYSVNVVDTTAPVITTTYDELDTDVLDKGSFDLKGITATDASDINYDKCKIVISRSGSTQQTMTGDKAQNPGSYNFSKDGTWTVVYTAYDNAGKTASKTFTFYVGDTEPPIITLSEDVVIEDCEEGSQLKFDLEDLYATDNSVEGNISATDITVVLKNSTTGATIANNLKADGEDPTGFEYDLSEVGEYTLTISYSDGTNSADSIVKEFVVSAKSAEATFPTETVGIILIVVSVLVLGSVVVYFVVTRKKTGKAPKKTTKK